MFKREIEDREERIAEIQESISYLRDTEFECTYKEYTELKKRGIYSDSAMRQFVYKRFPEATVVYHSGVLSFRLDRILVYVSSPDSGSAVDSGRGGISIHNQVGVTDIASICKKVKYCEDYISAKSWKERVAMRYADSKGIKVYLNFIRCKINDKKRKRSATYFEDTLAEELKSLGDWSKVRSEDIVERKRVWDEFKDKYLESFKEFAGDVVIEYRLNDIDKEEGLCLCEN